MTFLRRRVFPLLVVVLLLPFSPWAVARDEGRPLTVAVAANVRYAFDEIAAEFREETGIEVQGVSASSGKIAAQVKAGAPFDVFLSADTETPDALFREGWAEDAPRIYAYGVLVLWTAREWELKSAFAARGLELLADASVKRIAIPNPTLAPYGRAAMQALERARLRATVEPKLVYGESIAQAAQFVESGAADIGFNAKSIVLAPELAVRQPRWVEVPREGYDPIAQAAVILRHGAQSQPEVARRFIGFLHGATARAIFQKYGYRLP